MSLKRLLQASERELSQFHKKWSLQGFIILVTEIVTDHRQNNTTNAANEIPVLWRILPWEI